MGSCFVSTSLDLIEETRNACFLFGFPVHPALAFNFLLVLIVMEEFNYSLFGLSYT